MFQRRVLLLQAASIMMGLVSSERLVWSDEFDSLDESVWIHEVTTFPQAKINEIGSFGLGGNGDTEDNDNSNGED